MTNSSLLPLVLLLAISPLAAARPPFTQCDGDATYAANSTYQGNLRRLAAVLTAAVNASHGSYTHRLALCRRRDDDDNDNDFILICEDGACHGTNDSPASRYTSCAGCIASAFRGLESSCPYYKEAYFSDRNCSLQVNEVRIFGTDGVIGIGSYYGRNTLKETLASGLIFQAIGFAWLFFLLLKEWRGRKRGITTLSTPLIAEDH
ncbi:hypothetical protein EJB05_12029, partial [Eragrostis curvula]